MNFLKAALISSLLALSASVSAYEAGDMIFKGGIANVNPKSDSGINGVTVDDDTQIGLTFTYMFAPQFGVEVLASTPWEHDVKVNGEKVGSTKHLPPSVIAQYFPMSSSSNFQPYFGVGFNYTIFFDESGIVDKLDNSFGLALSAGMNYHINEEMLINFGAWKIDIDAELNNSGTDVEIDPLVMMLGVGYKF